MEPGIYQLSVYMDYSLCDGFKDPPCDWFIKRDAQGKYQKEGPLGPLDDYLVKPLQGGRLFEINVTTAGMNLSLTGKWRKSRCWKRFVTINVSLGAPVNWLSLNQNWGNHNNQPDEAKISGAANESSMQKHQKQLQARENANDQFATGSSLK